MLVQLVVIQVITFLAIVWVLRSLLYTETAREARRLKVLKEETAAKQKELDEKMKAAENVYKEKLAKAEEDGRNLRAKAEEEAEKKRRAIIDKAKTEAERVLKAAFNTKEKIRDEILAETQKKIPAVAANAFKEALSPNVKEIIHNELIGKLIERVKGAEKKQFSIGAKHGELIFARPIKKSDKEKLLDIIFEKVGRKIAFSEKENKELVAGAIVALETLVIDGSMENQLRQICETL